MRILFDTNVLLDFLADRPPHADAATELFAAVERGRLSGVIGATTVTTLHYLVGVGGRLIRVRSTYGGSWGA